MKRITGALTACILWCATAFLSAQQYQIRDVFYAIDGMTWEYSLRTNIRIDTDTVFADRAAFDAYIADITQQFQNLRILERSSVTWTEGPAGEDGVIPAALFIAVKDTVNMIALPYPKYNSNDGFELKIKYKDYSFLGAMEEFNADVLYEYNEDSEHVVGLGADFIIPFPIGIVESEWLNSYRFDFNITRKEPEFALSTGFLFSLPFDRVSLNLTVKQGFYRDLDYEEYGDTMYGQEYAEFAVPVTLAEIQNWGDIDWTPYISGTFNWNKDGIDKENDDLYGPRLAVGHSISSSRVNWYGNFREGASLSLGQSFTYNFSEAELKPAVTLSATGFKAFKYVGLAGRFTGIVRINHTDTMGSYLRGVLDDEDVDKALDNNGGIILNLDVPIKLFQTDWCGWGAALFKREMPDWLHYLDFEMQLSPFIDFALTYTYDTKTEIVTPRTWYTAGFEVLVFPSKFRSIMVRASLGFDLGRTLFKNVIDQSWRADVSIYELSIGVGLFY